MDSLLVCLLLVFVSPSHQYGDTDQKAGGERIEDSGLNFHENITEKFASVILDKMRAPASHIMPAEIPKTRHFGGHSITTLSDMATVTLRSQKRRNRTLNHRKPTPKRRKKSTKRVKPATKRPKPATKRQKPVIKRLKPTTTGRTTTPTRRVVYDSTIVCHLPIDPGNCEDLSLLPSPKVRYGYDRSEAGCIQFVYSGCGGNNNRFTSYNQCLTTCIPPEVSYNDFLILLQCLNRQSI